MYVSIDNTETVWAQGRTKASCKRNTIKEWKLHNIIAKCAWQWVSLCTWSHAPSGYKVATVITVVKAIKEDGKWVPQYPLNDD